MIRVNIIDGQALRKWDNQPLKTKIVATIGSPRSYESGIYNLELEKEISPPTYDYLIQKFIRNGVSVIRLNMVYMTEETTISFFESLRRNLAQRKSRKCPKCVVLTDLPGPRIRFVNFPETGITIPKDRKFTIRLNQLIDGTADGASVCINEEPLKQYLEKHNPKAFDDLMAKIENRLYSGRDVYVIVGDGDVIMEVDRKAFRERKQEAILECKVIKAGEMGNDRFTVKDVDFTIPSFTDEDKEKLELLFRCGAFQEDGLWAFIGLSFTQTAEDVLRAKKFIEEKVSQGLSDRNKEHASRYAPALIAKIETAKGYDNREEILDVADGIMVARGDLGVQKDIEEIGTNEKELIKLCNKRGKPVITATQMLGSMVKSLEPTRAEVTDVFNSILDGTDAVMLSEETSKGCYPFHAIRKMAFIAAEAEYYYEKPEMEASKRRVLCIRRYQEFLAGAEERIEQVHNRIDEILRNLTRKIAALRGKPKRSPQEEEELQKLEWSRSFYENELHKCEKQRTTDSISQSACANSENEKIKAIIALTTTGRAARMMSRFRPTVPIIGVTHDDYNACKLRLSHGVVPLNCGDVDDPEAGPGEMFKQAGEVVINEGLLKREDGVVLTSGNRPKEPGTTNTIQMQERLDWIL